MTEDFLIYSFLGSILVVFLFYVWIFFSKKTSSQTEAEEAKKRFHIRILKEVFDSKSYYTALSQALPRGKSDEKYGFDYIPFILELLEKKSARNRRTANGFLIATISLTFFFIAVSLVFSYILLIDSSIGINKEIQELKQIALEFNKTDQLAKIDDVSDRFESLNNFEIFSELKAVLNEKNRDKLLNFGGSEQKTEINTRDSVAIQAIKLKFEANRSLLELKTLLHKEFDNKQAFSEVLIRIDNGIENYQKVMRINALATDSEKNKIRVILEQISLKLNSERSQVSELIKRSIIGILIISFFIAILRYFRNLYQFHLNEMLKDEAREMDVRKFYIAIKCAESNSEERKLVLSNFISETKMSGETSQPSSAQQPEIDMLRDILNSLLKKI